MIAENPRPSLNVLKEVYNNTPDPQMHGLTPNQVHGFIYIPWGDPYSPIKFNKDLSLTEVNSSIFFRNTRLFLQTLLEFHNEITATEKGNLNRAFVKVIFEELEFDEKEKILTKKYKKALNETDAGPLHIIKIVCEVGGLIKKRSKRFFVPKKYQHLLSDEKAGELYYLLFEIYFKKFNLGYCDGFPKVESIQITFDYSLYRLSKICDNYITMDKLYNEIFLPKVKEEIRKTRTIRREIGWLVEVRIIRHLVKFGLLEAIYKKEKYLSRMEKVRKSSLFDKFLGWEV